MNGNMTYEGFIRAAFSVKSNELIDRYGDIAQLANTDVFDLSRSDLNYLNKAKMQNVEVNKADVAASFQKAVIEVLKDNVMETCKSRNVKKIAIAGGVASNSALRETIMNAASKKGIEVLFPAPVLCTDNAAMIGSAAYFNLVNGKISDLNLNAKPNLKL